MTPIEFFKENFEPYRDTRRYLHSRPEYATDTVETADFVKKRLLEYGIPFYDIGENSVIAEVDDEKKGKTIAFRCDMDALAIKEENLFDYRSFRKELMHACGHDGHTTIMLAVAQYLSVNRDFAGRILLIFQSGEEGFDGAKKIIEDGLFKKYEIDSIFGLHNWPGFESGKIVVQSGACMASEDRFYIRVQGKSGHASSPGGCIEPFAAVADIIKGCQTIIPRKIDPHERAVLSITKVNGGTADNIIPDFVNITGNVRACSVDVQDIIEDSVNDILAGVEKMYEVKTSLEYKRKHPVLVNTYVEPSKNAVVKSLGRENLITDTSSVMGSEDFALFLEHVKGCFVWIGNGKDSKLLHNSCYDFNDKIIPAAASYFVSLAWEILKP